MVEVSEEVKGAGTSAPLAGTDVEALYPVVLQEIAKGCSLYDVGWKDELDCHQDNAGASFMWRNTVMVLIELFVLIEIFRNFNF